MREHLQESTIPLHLTCAGSVGNPLTIACPEYGCSVQSPQPLQTAEKRPLTPEVLKQQLGRLGERDSAWPPATALCRRA